MIKNFERGVKVKGNIQTFSKTLFSVCKEVVTLHAKSGTKRKNICLITV